MHESRPGDTVGRGGTQGSCWSSWPRVGLCSRLLEEVRSFGEVSCRTSHAAVGNRGIGDCTGRWAWTCKYGWSCSSAVLYSWCRDISTPGGGTSSLSSEIPPAILGALMLLVDGVPESRWKGRWRVGCGGVRGCDSNECSCGWRDGDGRV